MLRTATIAGARILAVLVVAATSVGCGSKLPSKLGTPSCGTSGVECPQTPKTASKAVYHCVMAGWTTFDVPVCLPSKTIGPNLNRYVGSMQDVAEIDAMKQADYDQAVFDYGQNQVLNQLAALAAIDGDGGRCGDVLNSLNAMGTKCDLAGPGVRTAFCEDKNNFTSVSCCQDPTSGTCVPNLCKMAAGRDFINPNACRCNTLPIVPAECNINAGTVVFPPPGNDPTSGIVQYMLSLVSTASVDPNQSSAKVHIHFTDDFSIGHDDTQTSKFHGTASVFGRPREDGTAKILLDMYLQGSDVHFHFSNVDILGSVDLDVKNITLSGGVAGNYIELDAFGKGTIAKQTLAMDMEATIDGQKTIVQKTNDNPIAIQVDFKSKKFTIFAFSFSAFGADVTATIAGPLTNQPPRADAGKPQTVECTSPSGATVTLKGTASDPDTESLRINWLEGPPINPGDVPLFNNNTFVGDTLTITPLAPFVPPFATTGYTLIVKDFAFQTDLSQTTVRVQDTSAPVLVMQPPQPECLWAPNHKVVLYELGKHLPFTLQDTCDSNPKVEILDVTSNQPDIGGGQGNFAPDIVSGKTALCLRSERQGIVMWDREYTIRVIATDASGNTTIRAAVVRVPHDSSGAAKCQPVDPGRLVAEGDLRCAN